MGATFMTLHFQKELLAEIQKRFPDKDIRENGDGWMRVLLESPREAREAQSTMRKLPGTALLFDWFDDEQFTLTLYEAGRKVARLGWEQEPERLPRFAAVCPDDPTLVKKLRALPHCADIEEGLALLEESLGLRLYDLPEMEPQSTKRSEETWRRVFAREEALRHRLNRCHWEEVLDADWPQRLRLVPEEEEEDGRTFAALTPSATGSWKPIPGKPGRWMWLRERFVGQPDVVHAQSDGGFTIKKGTGRNIFDLDVFDSETGERRSFCGLTDADMALTVTARGEAVLLCYDEAAGHGLRLVRCVRETGEEVWRFAPALTPDESLELAGVEDDGTITLYQRIALVNPAMIWQIAAEDGSVLRSRSLAELNGVQWLRWLPDFSVYAYYDHRESAVVLLNHALAEQRRYPLGEKPPRFAVEPNVFGGCLWEAANGRIWRGLNLVTGEIREVKPELPAYLKAILPDGTMAGLSAREQAVILTDANGRIVSRNRVKRTLWIVFIEGDTVYALEDDAPKMGCGPLKGNQPKLWKLVNNESNRRK